MRFIGVDWPRDQGRLRTDGLARSSAYESPRRRAGAPVAIAVLVLLLAGLAPPAPAVASQMPVRGYVTMVTDSDAFVGDGRPHVFRSGDARILLGGTAADLTVSVSGGIDGGHYDFEFAAKPGEQLRPGLYTNVQNVVLRQPDQAGLNIHGDGAGCSMIGGRFDVKDIRTLSDGSVDRLWLTFEQHCEYEHPALFGEVRIGFPDEAGPLLVALRDLWWPDTDLGATASVVPITVFNTGRRAITIRSARVVGRHVRDFPIRLDECSERRIEPGGLCRLFIRFHPLAPGPRMAAVSIRDSQGDAQLTSLDGFAFGGRTRFEFASDSGDYIGQGGSLLYTAANATITVAGSSGEILGEILGSDGSRWKARFAAPDGERLVVGQTYDSVQWPFNNDEPGMSVTGQGRSCDIEGTFTVNALGIGPHNSVQSVGIRFEQHCDGGAPALRGAFAFRVPTGDSRPPDVIKQLRIIRAGSSATVRWRTPSDRDFAYTVIRMVQGKKAPVAPNAGVFVFAGKRNRARIRDVFRHKPLAVSAFAVDVAGNVSLPAYGLSAT